MSRPIPERKISTHVGDCEKRMIRFRFVIGAIVAAQGVPLLGGVESHHWSYADTDGPSHWANLDPKYAACAAKSQSPIEIAASEVRSAALPALEFNYRPTSLRLVDNGHTIEVKVDPGSSLMVGGKSYELVQFHFHRPSEEVIDGKRFAMVAHLVHRDPGGHLAVVAVPLATGRANALIETLWRSLPPEKGKEVIDTAIRISATALLPGTLAYYAYSGSLTTPPCSEGVRWLVLKSPSLVSPRQVRMFAARYSNNARPIQPRNGRTVLSSK